MRPQQRNTLQNSESIQETSSEPRIGFGAAQSEEQDEFDQAQMSDKELNSAMDSLVALFRKQKNSKTGL